jgi:hypothetical protein
MSEVDKGKAMILELVVALAKEEGIDSSRLLFKWDQEKLVMEEYGLELDDKLFRLQLLLGKRSQFLPFSELAVRTGVENPNGFASVNSACIVSALRKLRSAAMLVPSTSPHSSVRG